MLNNVFMRFSHIEYKLSKSKRYIVSCHVYKNFLGMFQRSNYKTIGRVENIKKDCYSTLGTIKKMAIDPIKNDISLKIINTFVDIVDFYKILTIANKRDCLA